MKIRRGLSLVAIAVCATLPLRASACIPPPPDPLECSPAKVKQRFDAVDSVMLVTLVKSRKVKVKEGGIDFVFDADEDTFRIDRVFKGSARAGQQFVLITTTTCGMSPHAAPHPVEMPRQWLFYRDAAEQSQLIDSPWMRPISQACDQLPILQELAERNAPSDSTPAGRAAANDRQLIIVE